jgi:UDP-N-acetylmuramoyl-tripeptide--D-alanyl-D-alanine ligase
MRAVNSRQAMTLSLDSVWRALGSGPWPDDPQWRVPLTEVVVDSRLAIQGSLFVALRGEHTDGHRFVGDAFQRGARAALVQTRITGYANLAMGQALDAQDRPSMPLCLLVSDTQSALSMLAAYWRSLHPSVRVAGVTGSVGKTTAKELIAAVLRQRFVTLKSPGNYNNEIGLPLTMLQLHSEVEWVVQEMGMYRLGEIAHLAGIARPQVGVVTNVGPTHLERLGSFERIAQAKAELLQALPEDGLAILNGDDERVRDMARLTPAREVVYYGLKPDADLWASDIQTRGLEGLRVTFRYRGQAVPAQLPLIGRHSIYAALAAVALGIRTGLSWDEILAGLRDTAVQTRMKTIKGVRDVTILDDTYNANPASMLAALEVLGELRGRRVAVLGGMLELGSLEQEGHRQVGRRAAQVASILVTVGRLGELIAAEAIASGMPADAVSALGDNQSALDLLRRILAPGDLVLVKGSRGFAMENLVAGLAGEA